MSDLNKKEEEANKADEEELETKAFLMSNIAEVRQIENRCENRLPKLSQ